MIKIFGILDLASAAIIIFAHFGLMPWNIALAIAAYLIFKGFAFGISLAGLLDVVTGLYTILIILGVHSFFVWIFALYLLQKAIFSIAA